MSNINVSLCQNFKISNLFCICRGDPNQNSLEFDLVDQKGKHHVFEDLLPESENYLFLKLNREQKIFVVEGKLLKKFKMKKSSLLNKYLYEIEKNKIFFLDFIKPLYNLALEKEEAYQFTFTMTTEEKNLVCTVYPCPLKEKTGSVDVVIRYPQVNVGKSSLHDYIVQSSNNGVVLPRLK